MVKKIITLILCCMLQFAIAAQKSQQTISSEEVAKNLEAAKASLVESQRKRDSSMRARTMALDSISNARNLNNITQQISKRNADQKKQAMIRIGIGVGLFAILIIGILRKKKK